MQCDKKPNPEPAHSFSASIPSLIRVVILLLLVLPNVYIGTKYLSEPSTSEHNIATPVAPTPAVWNPKMNPLGIPPGKAPNLPSPRLKVDTVQRKRYGGKGDAAHLGGFGEIDPGGIAPGLFKHMIEVLGVHSFLDIGCGRGFSTSWFAFHGVDVLCAEGSHDAIERSVLPDPATQVVEHDFSRGPWWPEKTYDAAWSVEFLEHVGTEYHFNYVSAFRKAALIFVTASKGTGWHHVEVHKNDWWIRKYESYGLKYDEALSNEAKAIARATKETFKGPHDMNLDGFYVRVTLMVFVNPVVAALPEHAHLFPQLGCFTKDKGARKCRKESGESVPDERMNPLNLTDLMDQKWVEWIEPQVKPPKSF
mmetsp:Transcript_24443/g.27287  ORF Transcript_24443/g.27287 Transcript_24443/m.27287 type:complete len:364 (+) Transcript_24443:124-1215(+)|eukprot:CAMPEP_0170955530 /NCGR_PEP_ID=MMETSP0735-20130129/33272_1 /TAXON_ID=186038 /ORGANISM="Fragilariopsis kerguelensis, Strain L26-C5" /LENGTH=363 /DNA_ID=CAMNT_0011367495 /DNA_START=99 /DNA_END=1190 /DNA_ORIENTATION=+